MASSPSCETRASHALDYIRHQTVHGVEIQGERDLLAQAKQRILNLCDALECALVDASENTWKRVLGYLDASY